MLTKKQKDDLIPFKLEDTDTVRARLKDMLIDRLEKLGRSREVTQNLRLGKWKLEGLLRHLYQLEEERLAKLEEEYPTASRLFV